MTPLKPSYPLAEIRSAAEVLKALLEPACDRIEIAGSIRRQQPTCHDIEIVAIPKLHEIEPARTMDLWGDELAPLPADDPRSRLVSDLESLIAAINDSRGGFLPRLTNGHGAWGPKYKRAWFLHAGHSYPVDLFAVTPPAQWGAILAIRTGPADVSHKLVTPKTQGGFMPFGFEQRDGALWQFARADSPTAGGQVLAPLGVIETPEEADFFAALGLACPPPEARHSLNAFKLPQPAEEVPSCLPSPHRCDLCP